MKSKNYLSINVVIKTFDILLVTLSSIVSIISVSFFNLYSTTINGTGREKWKKEQTHVLSSHHHHHITLRDSKRSRSLESHVFVLLTISLFTTAYC
jgi:uncharacterized protein (UPF0548 family)